MPVKWKQLFSSRILDRGRKYCDDGRVMDLTKFERKNGETAYEAVVKGSEFYFVKITIKNSKVSRIFCDCPHALDGSRCKHMAAVLYEMEEMGLLETPEEENLMQTDEVFPFKKSDDGGGAAETGALQGVFTEEYHYYDMEKITRSIIIDRDTFDKANRLINSNRVTLENVREGYQIIYDRNYHHSNSRVILAEGIYHGNSGKNACIRITASRNQLIIAECDVMRCFRRIDSTFYHTYRDSRFKVCEHIMALLVLLDEYIRKYNPGDVTDSMALDFLNRYRSRAIAGRRLRSENAESGEKNPVVNIEPRLEVGEYGELSVSFKVGKGKGYVVKNIPELTEIVDAGGEYALGKSGKIDFAAETFDEKSTKYYEFLAKEVKGEVLRDHNSRLVSRYNMEPGGEEIKNIMPLFGKRLDEFYELAKNSRLPFVSKKDGEKSTGEAILQEKMPDVNLGIAALLNDEGRFEGINLYGDFPKLIDGIDHQYYFEDDALNRADNGELEILNMLRESRYSSSIYLDIGLKNLSEFYYRILPMLEEIAEIRIGDKDRDIIEKHLYPEAAFEFFLDADEENVICDVKVSYGEADAVLMEPPAEDSAFEVFRDMQRELEVDAVVCEYLPFKDPQTGTYHCNGDESLVYSLVANGVNNLLEFGEVQATDRFKNLRIRRKPQISVGVNIESDLLNLSISSGDLSEEELLELLASYRRKKKFHRLRNGDFIPADSAALEELSAMLDVMSVSSADFVKGKMHLPLYRAIYLDRMLEKNDELYAKRDSHFKSLIRNFKTVGDSDYEIPHSLQGIMRGYQEFGFKWLKTIEECGFGGILADDMGLGKTLQVIAVLLAAKEQAMSGIGESAGNSAERIAEDAGAKEKQESNAGAGNMQNMADAADGTDMPALIVTPASLVYNWYEEFAKFAPVLDVCTITGTKSERKNKLKQYRDYDVIITSYDLLKRDIAEYEDKRFSYQIIDEAQFIKNHTTAAAKAVKVINSKVRFALTGTPIENRLSELWSIFDFLMPGFLYGYEQFRREMETPIARNKDEAAMAQLKRMVEPFILRRLKSEVLKDLPDKIEETHYVAFEKAQQELYDGQVVRMKKMLEEGSDEDFAKNKIRLLAEITRIRQICCDPSLCFENYRDASAKREACMELIRSAIDGEHKMLLFSQFTSMLDILEGELIREGIRYYKITGATKKEERVELVRCFNSDDTPVFLISLKAGGTGLNLTGADIVIHYDPWWNLAAQNQATDRAHRIGQEKNVTVYKLIVKGSIEEKIQKMQETKKALADEILSGETGGLMTMSREDLLALF